MHLLFWCNCFKLGTVIISCKGSFDLISIYMKEICVNWFFFFLNTNLDRSLIKYHYNNCQNGNLRVKAVTYYFRTVRNIGSRIVVALHLNLTFLPTVVNAAAIDARLAIQTIARFGLVSHASTSQAMMMLFTQLREKVIWSIFLTKPWCSCMRCLKQY